MDNLEEKLNRWAIEIREDNARELAEMAEIATLNTRKTGEAADFFEMYRPEMNPVLRPEKEEAE